MRRATRLVPFAVACACGPAPASSPPAALPAPATSSAAPPAPTPASPSPRAAEDARSGERQGGAPKLRLGHYSSRDGLFGLVLDRTAPRPRVRVDGSTEVLELAVRQRGDDVVSLISTREDLLLDITASGRISMRVGPDKDAALLRDGDAERLPEPPAPTVDAALMTSLDARLKQKCGAAIHAQVTGKPPSTATRGVYVALERATRALEQVCRDAAGQSAVRAKVRVVRVSHDKTERIAFDGDVLTVQGDLESAALGPFSDQVRSFVEGKL